MEIGNLLKKGFNLAKHAAISKIGRSLAKMAVKNVPAIYKRYWKNKKRKKRRELNRALILRQYGF